MVSMFKKIQLFQSLWLITGVLISSTAEANNGQQQRYDRHALQTLAEQYITDQAHIQPDQELQVQAMDLDARIGPRECAVTPQASTASAPPFNRQVTVKLKCPSPALWSQYVHVRISKLSTIVVANDHIARGQIISADDLTTEQRPQHFVRARYIEQPEVIVGSRSKRSIRRGLPISMNQLCMVCKGDNVSIIARFNGLTIKTSGEALEDGGVGDNIRVRNVKSGRLINAKVTAVETVAVNI